MSCCSKEKMERSDCFKSYKSQKQDREMFRVCPSKLSKRELEDLYFTLLENNLELKKTINGQEDKIKMLSTQVQRLTSNQEKRINKEMKECCTGTKAFVNEQKDFITELKETNQRLAERIQHLNLRLSSAKQFVKGPTPPQAAAPRPVTPFRVASLTPKKHDCLNKVQEAPPPHSPPGLKLSTFSQWEDKSPKKSTQTQISGPVEKCPQSDRPCDENKCRSLMEELKLKVVTLQEELGNVHKEYSTRIGRLETQVSEVRKENVRVIGERSASEHELQNSIKQNSEILARFISTEAKCAELAAELSIEKRKVAELETLLKASNMTDKINKTLENHLQTLSDEQAKCKKCCFPEVPAQDNGNVTSPTGVRTRFSPTKEMADIKSKLLTKTSDVPQYDVDSDEMALLKQNKHLLVKILELQNEMDSMKKEHELICVKCCKDKSGAAESSPSKNSKALSPGDATPRPSPTKDKDDTKSTNTADDSGYQDSDEMGLQKMNKELLEKVLELQNQIDCLKIGVCQTSEAPGDKLQESIETNKPAGSVKSPPSLGKLEEPESSAEFPQKASEEHVSPSGKILRIEVLGSLTDSSEKEVQPVSSEDTRAKTVQDSNGMLQITEEPSPNISDDYIVNYDSTTELKDIPKLTITEKKKIEVADNIQPDAVSVKSYAVGPGLPFNPEKLKYLENERVIAKSDSENRMAAIKEDTESIAESVPSNPELGFDIPRLVSKANQAKKTEIGSGQPKKSQQDTAGTSTQRPRNNDYFEDDILPDELKVPMTEALADKPTTPKPRDEAKEEEDCQYCAACSFDKECELKHKNAINPRTNKLAHGVQKELCRNRDLENALEIPDPIPISDNKKDKKKNMFCHFIKDATRNEKNRTFTKEELLLSRKTSITSDRTVNLADVPVLRDRENNYVQHKDSLKIAKKTMFKKEQCVQSPNKKDVEGGSNWYEETPILFAKKDTYDKAASSLTLADVPILRKKEKNKLNEVTDHKETSLIVVKPPTANVPPFSERMLPVLEGPIDDEEAKRVAHAADMTQNTENKSVEKASQAPTTPVNIADAARISIRELSRHRDVSLYRRTSGTFCFRSVPAGQEPLTCTCAGQHDGYCTAHPKTKGVQVPDNEAVQIGTPRERRRLSLSERGTYTVGSNRAATPDTDHEMTYLSDLPMEDEKKSPVKSRPLSPGEDRTPTYSTATQSDNSRPTDSSLSEGEMQPSTSRRNTIDADRKIYLNPTLAHKLETPPAQQMEAALNAISHELRHCKNLLHANRPPEVTRLSTVIL